MNLNKVRLQLTVLFTAVFALAVILMTVLAARAGEQRLVESAERELDIVMGDYALEQQLNEGYVPNNAWLVDTDQEVSNSLGGDIWVEPPLIAFANTSYGGRNYLRFEQDGPWIAGAQHLQDDNFLVVAIEFDDFAADIGSLKWQLSLAAIGIILGVGFVAWRLAGRSLEPARIAMG